MSPDLAYVALLFLLFVVPKGLQRYRIPSAVTAFVLGIGAARLGWFAGEPTVILLSTLGITALFLFAGLDVEPRDLRRGAGLMLQHLLVYAALLLLTARAASALFDLEWRAAVLLALALVTPSTGFILDSLSSWKLGGKEVTWTRTKAVSTEILALAILFVVTQSSTLGRFALSAAALAVIVLVVPALLRAFAAFFAPYAPRSEFAFLVMLAVLAAIATRKLGVYYLVGAFLVGVAARRFRDRMPAFSSERMLHAVEVFASFFAPFYFFAAGAHLRTEMLRPAALVAGLIYLAVFLPVRFGVVLLHRRLALGESWASGRLVATALLPTLVFSLVVAELLAERFTAPAFLVGGIIPYALGNTFLPALLLKSAPSFDAPTLEAGHGTLETDAPAGPPASPPAGLG